MSKKQFISLVSVLAVVLLSLYAYVSVCKLRWIPPDVMRSEILGSINLSTNETTCNYAINIPKAYSVFLLFVVRDGLDCHKAYCSTPSWDISCNISLSKREGDMLLAQTVASDRMQYASWYSPDTAVLLDIDKFSEALRAGGEYLLEIKTDGQVDTTNHVDVVLYWFEVPAPTQGE